MGWRALSAALCIVSLMVSPSLVRAVDESDTAQSTVGGTIPELCQILITNTGLTTLLSLSQDASGEVSYDQGYVESAADATALTLDANKSWSLGVNYAAPWSCPGSYDKAESDLRIQITNTPTGTIRNGASSYISVPAAKTAILDHTSGVSDNSVEIQYQVLLDWTHDIPGAYSITVTYTMETTP